LLDANILSHPVRQPQGRVAARIADAGEGNVLTSLIVACELRCDAAERGSRRLARQTDAILGAITIRPLEAGTDRQPCRHSHNPGEQGDADRGDRQADRVAGRRDRGHMCD
jgi:predicted nucleic acid-binding protein